MPEISRFFGIVIYMFYNEHFPPHFHAKYTEYEAVIWLPDPFRGAGRIYLLTLISDMCREGRQL